MGVELQRFTEWHAARYSCTRMRTPTITQARQTCRTLGYTLRHNDGEFELHPIGDRTKAYFTGCPLDAIETAQLSVQLDRSFRHLKGQPLASVV